MKLFLRQEIKGPHHRGCRGTAGALLMAGLLLSQGFAQPAGPEPGLAFATPVEESALDPVAFGQSVDGKFLPVKRENNAVRPQSVLWTRQSSPDWAGVRYGEGTSTGARHLRIGFTVPLPVGSVMVRGGGKLSVLKPDVTYPGHLNNEADWLPAERLQDGRVSMQEVGGKEYGIWVLPPGTTTRAIRFSHTPQPTDAEYSCTLHGALVLADRVRNIAPSAVVSVSSMSAGAARLTNGIDDSWDAWANLEPTQAGSASREPVSEKAPEQITLVWPEANRVDSVVFLWAGFQSAKVEIFQGPENQDPLAAQIADWKRTGGQDVFRHGYPLGFWPNRLALGQPVNTRALRILLTESPETDSHEHLKGKDMAGKRVWLGEVMVLQNLGEAPLDPLATAADEPRDHPPIPVRFTLSEPGYVTLVINDESGRRVRNLLAETWFPAGENTAWWDGTDDLTRDVEAAAHGVYRIPPHLVAPGTYRVKGLVRGAITPHYEFSVYSSGNPVWPTADKSGAWLSNHTPPQAALFVPADKSPTKKPMVYLGSYISEGRDGLAWVDLDGNKIGGQGWVGGNWTGAPYLALDSGSRAIIGHTLYVASVFKSTSAPKRAELRLTAVTRKGDKPMVRWEFDPKAATPEELKTRDPSSNSGFFEYEIRGLAAHNGILAVSLPREGGILFSNGRKKDGDPELWPIADPRGLAYDSEGRLLVLSGGRLLRLPSPSKTGGQPETLIESGLEDPSQLTLDRAENIYISDHGNSHQVKVFDPSGKFLRAIGLAGAPKAGPYDPLHMNNPFGMAIDDRDQLWVAENDYLPKRVSVWTLDGKLVKAFYGPGKYGGGGAIDPLDKSRFYYADEKHGTLEFLLDWEQGTSQLANVLYRPGLEDLSLTAGYGTGVAPETALYFSGRRYFTNCFNSNPTNGAMVANLFADRDGTLAPIVGMGVANEWKALLSDEMLAIWPAGVDPTSAKAPKVFFIWSDLNSDTFVQPEEVILWKADAMGVTVMPDLSFCIARLDGRTMRFAPVGFTDDGVPRYDFDAAEVLADGVERATSTGGSQALAGRDGQTIVTLGIKPFPAQSLSGTFKGEASWSYPSLWPGLHASHEAPVPDRPGQLVGTTRLLGGFIEPRGSDAGQLWAVNSNHGHFYLFTSDGLFVAEVFKDMRIGKPWAMPAATRGMDLSDLTLHDENFWPTISQTSDGKIYLVDGGRTSIVRLDGLESIRRLPESVFSLTPDDLKAVNAWNIEAELRRQSAAGSGILEAALRQNPPAVDGRLDDWSKAKWVDIDRSGAKAYFNSDSKPFDVRGALAVSGEKLYAAYRTGLPDLLKNAGGLPNAPFKTGGALDLMLGVDAKANPERREPVPGDMRLLVTVVEGKPRALLYRAVVPGAPETDKVPFSSPSRTITFDKVEDVSGQVQLAASGGNFEFSVPLQVLGLNPGSGQSIRGDIGILRGNGVQTAARVYWKNKATGITSDVPSEAMLVPGLWGTIRFEREQP
jgi:hypothetical protein